MLITVTVLITHDSAMKGVAFKSCVNLFARSTDFSAAVITANA